MKSWKIKLGDIQHFAKMTEIGLVLEGGVANTNVIKPNFIKYIASHQFVEFATKGQINLCP